MITFFRKRRIRNNISLKKLSSNVFGGWKQIISILFSIFICGGLIHSLVLIIDKLTLDIWCIYIIFFMVYFWHFLCWQLQAFSFQLVLISAFSNKNKQQKIHKKFNLGEMLTIALMAFDKMSKVKKIILRFVYSTNWNIIK